ncbi:MAG: type II secretion system protein GspG [Pseudomonadales bacterium]|nr:type II secretion system protein GspG [Pseudomonadales bacterium]
MIPPALSAEEKGWLDPLSDKIENALNVYRVALEFHRIEKALEEYEAAHDAQLSPDAGLRMLVKEGYLEADDIMDPWGTRYRLRYSIDPEGGYVIYLLSAGPDRTHETDDDLGN